MCVRLLVLFLLLRIRARLLSGGKICMSRDPMNHNRTERARTHTHPPKVNSKRETLQKYEGNKMPFLPNRLQRNRQHEGEPEALRCGKEAPENITLR